MKKIAFVGETAAALKLAGEVSRISESRSMGWECVSVLEYRLSNRYNATDAMYGATHNADVLVIDVSSSDPDNDYAAGYAHGLLKPAIMIRSRHGRKAPTPQINYPVLLSYDNDVELGTEFVESVVNRIKEAIATPDSFLPVLADLDPPPKKTNPTVFVSYSHRDKKYLDRLQIHLRPLVKQNKIDLWDDTRISAGADWKSEIEGALSRAGVAVLLISADYLASDFIVDNELGPILEKAQASGTLVIPLVVRHCRFLREPSLSRFQSLNDPAQPLESLSSDEQERIWDEVSVRVEVTTK